MDQYTRLPPSPDGASVVPLLSPAGAAVVGAAAAVVAAVVSAVCPPPPHAVRETAIADAITSAITFFFIKNILLFLLCFFYNS